MARRGQCWVCYTVSGTPEERWESIYGTTAYGNLPQYKKTEHSGHCWHPCPYSLQCDDTRSRMLLGLDVISGTLPNKVDHMDVEGRFYYMQTTSRGNLWGYECTYPGCSFSGTGGVPYFFA